ncbi:hypothetical protein RND81_06G021200 [Saponaria officinalis]|uniref:Uncharacterized protein n=1 Tax=Saponaria officinalis TaxID=3572 RepID=A0AAW1K8R2_SAPOF
MMNYPKMVKKLKLDGEYLHQFTCFKNTSTYSPNPINDVKIDKIDKIVTSCEDFGNIISTATREQIYVTNNNNHQVYIDETKLKLKEVKRPQDKTGVTPGRPGGHN